MSVQKDDGFPQNNSREFPNSCIESIQMRLTSLFDVTFQIILVRLMYRAISQVSHVQIFDYTSNLLIYLVR